MHSCPKILVIPLLQNPQPEGKRTETYNSGDSLVVTNPTTNLPISSLCMAERTGCPVLLSLWSYVMYEYSVVKYVPIITSGGGEGGVVDAVGVRAG